MKQKIYPLLFGTLLPFLIIIFFYRSTVRKLDIPFQRIFITSKLDLKNTVPVELDAATKLAKYKDNYFVYDLATNKINQYGTTKEPAYNSCPVIKYGVVLGILVDSSGTHIIDGRKNHYIHTLDKTCQSTSDSIVHLERGKPISAENIIGLVNARDKDVDMVILNGARNTQKAININLVRYKDGGFGNDGVFSNSSAKDKICYVLYHIGRFYVIDLNNDKARQFQTLDRYTTPPEVARSGGGFTLSRKAFNINRISANDQNYLYIVSNLKTRSDKSNHIETDIIDVYSLESGEYVKSFNVGGTEKEHIVDLCIEGKNLTILTKKRFLSYEIN